MQFTVAGEGELKINNKVYKQKSGDVFLIERPGPYSYWLPNQSIFWEFKFITFSISAIPFWNTITRSFGRTFNISPESEVIKYIDLILALLLPFYFYCLLFVQT
jgi:hypothetical protein